jgi:hypothetical protein
MDELGQSKARKVAIGAAVGIAVGSIGPWADTFLGSVAGTRGGDGKLTLVIAIVVGLIALLTKRPSQRRLLVLAGLGLALDAYAAIHDLVKLETKTQELLGSDRGGPPGQAGAGRGSLSQVGLADGASASSRTASSRPRTRTWAPEPTPRVQ